MSLFAFIGFLVFVGVVGIIAAAVSSRMQKATFQDSFARGQVPQPKLNDFYPGISHILFGLPVPWMGKRFTLTPEGGTNLFSRFGGAAARLLTPRYKHFVHGSDATVSGYTFKTATGVGLRDPHVQVLKLDYNLPENPGLIRIIYDELVQVDPGRYLGKVYIQALPGWFLFVGFFELKATQKVSVEPSPVNTAPAEAVVTSEPTSVMPAVPAVVPTVPVQVLTGVTPPPHSASSTAPPAVNPTQS